MLEMNFRKLHEKTSGGLINIVEFFGIFAHGIT